MKENNVQDAQTKLVDDFIGMNTKQEEATITPGEAKEESMEDLLSNEPVVGKPAKRSNVGKTLAVAGGVGVVGAAAAGVGAYAIGSDTINDLLDVDDKLAKGEEFVSDLFDDQDKKRVNISRVITGSDQMLSEEFVEEPIAEPTEEFVEEHIEEPIAEPIDEFVEEYIEKPIAEPTEEFVEEHIEKPIAEPTEEFVEEYIEEHIAEPTEEDIVVPTEEPAVIGHSVDVNVSVTPIVSESDMPNGDSLVSLASVNTSGMSFGEAFAAARAEVGPNGVFEWNGGYYGTYYENEWADMSDEFKREFNNHNWSTEFSSGNVEVALDADGIIDDDLLAAADGDVDVEVVADDALDFEMSFVLDGEVSMTEIMEEVNENLPGEIVAGNFEVEVEVVSVDPLYETHDDNMDELYANDSSIVDDDMPDDDLLNGIMSDNDDLIC